MNVPFEAGAVLMEDRAEIGGGAQPWRGWWGVASAPEEAALASETQGPRSIVGSPERPACFDLDGFT